MRRSLLLPAIVLASGCAGDPGAPGADGTSYLTDIGDEPAGANCAAGGVRIATGPDTNANGALDADEIVDTEYVCASPRSLNRVTPEPAGANCPAGGAKIETGADANNNNTLDPAEVADTDYVCGAGTAQIVTVYADDVVNVPAPTVPAVAVTARQASINVTTPGRVLAIWSADLYCSASQCPNQAAGIADAQGTVWLALTDTQTNPVNPNTEPYEFFFLESNVTESVTRATTFDIATPGNYVYYLRGRSDARTWGFYRAQLTLVYLPAAGTGT